MKHYVKNLFFIVIGLILGGPLPLLASKNSKKPNIVVIMTDDLGYGDLSITGGKDVHTPNIDELFTRGVVFTEFYSNSSVGSPTQAAFLTGRYPGLVGVQGVIRRDSENSWGNFNCSNTLSSHLKEKGYVTALIGKWNLGFESPNLPNEKGFDLFMGFLGDQVDNHYTRFSKGNSCMYFNENEITPPGHTTDLFSNWSMEFIKREVESEQPFFLYLAYAAPGLPLQPEESWLKKVQEEHPELTTNRLKNVASIEHLDDGVGRIIQALDETNQLKNTIIVFSSENSGILSMGGSNGAMRGGKPDLYEGGIRIPTSIYWKEKIKKGSICHQVSMTMDLFPTLCGLTEDYTNWELDGADLTTCILKDIPLQKERPLFWICREGGKYKGKAYFAVRQGAYKLIQNSPFEPFNLYNLTTDSYEQIPLKKGSEHYQRLETLLHQHILDNEKISWAKNDKDKSASHFGYSE